MVSYDLLLYMLKIETTTRGTNSMPFLVFQRDHFRSTSGIICGSGSFVVQLGDHFRSEDHLWSNLGIISGLKIICGRGSFAALYNTKGHVMCECGARLLRVIMSSSSASSCHQ